MIRVDILIISLSNPVLVGIYSNESKELISNFELKDKSSDSIPMLFQNILKEYKIDSIFYTNGPGSFMATKVIYLFIMTLSKVYNIKIGASLGFEFNNYSAIKALGKKYFIYNRQNSIITIESLNKEIEPFKLPKILDREIFSFNEIEPKYMLNAV
jgi:tRNA A37 threonylcarbamoyladenosine modification protein TsaB